MSKKTFGFIVCLVLLAIALGVLRYFVVPVHFPQLLTKITQEQTLPTPTPTPFEESPIEINNQKVASFSAQLLQRLTPRQKVAQLLAVPVTVASNSAVVNGINAQQQTEIPGFYTLFGSNISALSAEQVIKQLKQNASAPSVTQSLAGISVEEQALLQPLIAVDQEGGTVARLSGQGLTLLPSAAEQCEMQDQEFQTLLTRVAKELRTIGIDMVLAPVIDLAENNPVMKSRICSADPEKVRQYGEQWIQIMQEQRIVPVLKHYPGIGEVNVDLHTTPAEIDFSPQEHSVFMALLSKYQGVGVMTTHVKVRPINTQQTASSAAELCTISADCVGQITLPGQHFRLTDGLEMVLNQQKQGSNITNLTELTKQSILAGHTIIIYGRSTKQSDLEIVISELANEYQKNSAFKQKVDAALQEVWTGKYFYQQSEGGK
jgi:hypothetical protein